MCLLYILSFICTIIGDSLLRISFSNLHFRLLSSSVEKIIKNVSKRALLVLGKPNSGGKKTGGSAVKSAPIKYGNKSIAESTMYREKPRQ